MGEWPLVGREAELSRLRSVVIGRTCSAAVIVGAVGVGKTRLAVECLRMAERAGLSSTRVAAVRTAEGRLAELAGGQALRTVVLVDDAHLLDDKAAGLLLQVVMDRVACVVATVSAGEPTPDGIVALWKDGLAGRFDLPALQRAAIEDLLWTSLRGPVEPATVTALFNLSQGNMHFLRELVNGALEDGSLRDDGGIWRLVAPLVASRPLVELVDLRMGRLDEADRDVLEMVAFGEPLGRAELTAVDDASRVDQMVRRGLLVSRLEQRRFEVRLAHPLYGELLRRRLPPLRVPAIARSLAEAVEATAARRREDTVRLATWNVAAGVSRPALMLAAAREARWHYDFPLAERLALAAFDGGAGFEAAVLAAQVACLQGRVSEAQDRLAALADQATTDAERGVAAVNLIDTLGVYRGWMDEGLRLAEQIESSITDPNWRNEIAARRAVILSAIVGPEAAAELALPLVEQSTGRALVWACMCAAFTLPRLGRTAEALELVDRGHAEHLELTQPIDRYPWIHAWLRCEALAHAGRLHEAEALALAEHEQGVADASAEARAYFAWHLATVVGDRGHVRGAARHAREGVALNRELGRPHYVGECLIGLALALALMGEGRGAVQALADFDALELPHAVFKPVELALARGWTAVASADLRRAGELFGAAADEARRRGDLVGEAAALHSRARIDRPAEVLGRLEALAAVIEGDLAAGRAAHVRALAAGDADGLVEVSAAFERMGADLLAAEAAAQAAVALRRRGEPRRGTAVERRMEGLRERCEGAVTPALQAVGARVPLTRSERRVALMAAEGRSNSEIAGGLCVSVRTVENHLRSVYEKLGIHGRGELADALGP